MYWYVQMAGTEVDHLFATGEYIESFCEFLEASQ